MLVAAGSSALRRSSGVLWRQWKHRFMLMTLPVFCNAAVTSSKAAMELGEAGREAFCCRDGSVKCGDVAVLRVI